MTLLTYDSREALMAALAARLVADLSAALARRDRVTLCVPGGTTPGPVFDILAATALDWARVDVLLNDERWVPEDHARSNTRLLRERLLTGAAAGAGCLPLYAPAPEPEDALDALSGAIAARLPLEVVLLGMGGDMHTASLFPGADRLAQALAPDAPVLVAMRAPGAPEPRITLSARVLNTAPARHIVITGDEKRAAYERALTLAPEEAPVAAVLPGAVVHWAP